MALPDFVATRLIVSMAMEFDHGGGNKLDHLCSNKGLCGIEQDCGISRAMARGTRAMMEEHEQW